MPESSLFNNVAGLGPSTLLKKDPKQVFSCEYCTIFYPIQDEARGKKVPPPVFPL